MVYMQNKSYFPKIFYLPLLFLFLNFSSSAQIFHLENFHLSYVPIIEYSSGVLNETFYQSLDKNKKRSLLEWERKIWLYGMNINGNYQKIYFSVGVFSSIPGECGEMRDSDWKNPLNYEMKTNYSFGTNFSDKNYDILLSISYQVEPYSGFFIYPKIQSQYLYDSFYRKKGAVGWYADSDWSSDGKNHWWYDDESMKFPSLNPNTGKTRKLAGINYLQHSFYVWAGFSLGFRIFHFHADFDFLISPFTYFSSEDYHKTATGNEIYHLILHNYFESYKFGLNLRYEISRYFDITLRGLLLITKESKGNLYYGWNLISDQSSGMNSKIESISIGCGIKFL